MISTTTSLQVTEEASQAYLRASIETQSSIYIAYNNAKLKLKKYTMMHLGEHPNLLDFLASPSVNNLLSVSEKNKEFNSFISLIKMLASLAEKLPICDEEILYDPCREVMLNAINLTRVLAEEHFKARTISRRHNMLPRAYDQEMNELTIALEATKNMLGSPNQNNKEFVAAISHMQNSIEPSISRLMREHPYKTAFISSALVVAGISMFAVGIIITPVIFLAAVALTLSGITIFCVGLTGLVTPAVEKLVMDEGTRKVVETASITTKSMYSLAKSTATLFAKQPEMLPSASISLLPTTPNSLIF
jgi:hypothetical protein